MPGIKRAEFRPQAHFSHKIAVERIRYNHGASSLLGRVGRGLMVNAAIDGRCHSRLQRVRKAFVENFTQHGEVGAAVAVTTDGKPIVDWAFWNSKPWPKDLGRKMQPKPFPSASGCRARCNERVEDALQNGFGAGKAIHCRLPLEEADGSRELHCVWQRCGEQFPGYFV